ncbi:glycosyltransferase family 4 protein [Paramicrobacterium fandaimingii]|uniref:glycosyltransferase family 4 protein n=1 Tax=Paramicrobacterium fandaimingii TaxID=2708079 RepID=UPI00141DF18F|nr:glycosyltransferase family 4 protein [Microbacterium fandaimingii]
MGQGRTLVLSHTAQEGGAELALVRLVRRLRERGDDVHVLLFAHGPLEDALAVAGVPTTVRLASARMATASRGQLSDVRHVFSLLTAAADFIVRLRSAIRESGADLVVANSLKSAALAVVAAPISGRAWVWNLHDRLTSDYLPRGLLIMMRTIAVLGPRKIIVNSRSTLETIPRWARRRAVIAYPGIADDAFVTMLPDSPRVVGIVGRVSPTKGQHIFVEAAIRVAQTHPDVAYRVIGTALFGEQNYEAAVRERARESAVADRMEFTGWVRDVPAQIGRLSILVHASPMPEPFGQIVVEAIAASVPVIATESGGVVEILDAGSVTTAEPDVGWRFTDLGVLVRPDNAAALASAIVAVLDDPKATIRRAQRARADVSDRYAISHTADVVSQAWSEARRQRPSQRTRSKHEVAN